MAITIYTLILLGKGSERGHAPAHPSFFWKGGIMVAMSMHIILVWEVEGLATMAIDTHSSSEKWKCGGGHGHALLLGWGRACDCGGNK